MNKYSGREQCQLRTYLINHCGKAEKYQLGFVRSTKKSTRPSTSIQRQIVAGVTGAIKAGMRSALSDYSTAFHSRRRCSISLKIKMNMNQEKVEQEFQHIEADIEREQSFNPLSFVDLMAREFKDTEWMVEQLVPSESIVAMSGAPSAYKTWLVLDLAINVAKGDILFDKFVTNQGGVLVVDEENGERLLQKRLQILCKSAELPIFFLSLSGFKLEKKIIERIISRSEERR